MAFPVVAASNTTADTSSGSITVNMPAGIVAGNLLIVFCAQDASGTVTQSGGSTWTKLEQVNNSTICGLSIFAKVATGGDTLTLASTNSQDAACVSVRITGHGVTNVATQIIKGAAATGSNAAPDPPNCNPGTVKEYLWLEAFGADDDDNAATYWSANYSAVAQVESASSTSSCLCAVGQRSLSASAENPGAMAMALAEEWVAQTLAIPPDPNLSVAATPGASSWSGAAATGLPGAVAVAATAAALGWSALSATAEASVSNLEAAATTAGTSLAAVGASAVPGPVSIAGLPANASWGALSATPGAGPVTVSAAPAGASWVTLGATVSPGAVTAVATTTEASWSGLWATAETPAEAQSSSTLPGGATWITIDATATDGGPQTCATQSAATAWSVLAATGQAVLPIVTKQSGPIHYGCGFGSVCPKLK